MARYYSSTQGRFTSPDEFIGGPDELYFFAADGSDNPTFYADLTDPQSLNKYSYAYNNPLRWIDLDGHEAEEIAEQDPKPTPEPNCQCRPIWVPTRNPVEWFFDEIINDRRHREEWNRNYEQYQREVREGMEKLSKPIEVPPLVVPAPKPQPLPNTTPPATTPRRTGSPEMRRRGRGGKQKQRDSELANEKDRDVSRKARDKSLRARERRRYQKEEKARGIRNKKKRKDK